MKSIEINRNNKGFTLIELIVVVSIVLILSGFLVPKVLGYQDKAKNAKVVNTARQIFDVTMEDYLEEEGTLTQSKVFALISAVIDSNIGTQDVEVSDNIATIKLASDNKTYNVIVSPNISKFSVNLVTGTPAGTTNEVYKNK